ncbi:MAG: hypothetical protein JWP09_400 [Candidatus Taylorbacteria bacterium]|nr:hypothetical protein [Candidatus Taylorbacteria bacterium]
MHILKLQGGLGNQLFEYAFARAYGIRNDTEVKYDFDFFKTHTYLTYGLGYFNTILPKASKEECARFKIFKKQKGIIGRIYNPLFANSQKYIEEYTFHFLDEYMKNRKDSYFDGWWQSYKYFEDIHDILRKELILKDEIQKPYTPYISKMNATESVVIHIRRGDYANNPGTTKHHGLTSREYYEYSINEISKKIPHAYFFIFSDEIAWAKEHFKIPFPCEYVDVPTATPHEELVAMSHAKHFIIANSTFSWWAAWLSNNKNKLVYAPKKWFNKGWNTDDLTPPEWKRV